MADGSWKYQHLTGRRRVVHPLIGSQSRTLKGGQGNYTKGVLGGSYEHDDSSPALSSLIKRYELFPGCCGVEFPEAGPLGTPVPLLAPGLFEAGHKKWSRVGGPRTIHTSGCEQRLSVVA